MKKRLVVILLALSISVTSLSGCGNSNTSDTAVADYEPAVTEEYTTYDEAPAEAAASDSYKAGSEAAGSKSNAANSAKNFAVAPNATSDSYATEQEAVEEESLSAKWYDNTRSYRYEQKAKEDISNEKYTEIDENGFKDVSVSPLSTFAADVDTASYANMRRLVNEGYGLYDFPKGAVRTEELLNYFDYDYSSPRSGERFAVDAVVSDCPWNDESKLMILGINTKDLKRKDTPDSNIVFLVDVSGSMSRKNKLELFKEAMGLLTENLGENDRVSIVTYASGTDVVLEGVRGNETRKINRAFESLEASGSTNGEGGIEKAYEIAQENFIKGGNNRIILATDGDFNVGKTSGSELKEMISEKKETGVYLSVLGFGMGNYNDTTAETLADAGNGNYSYIDTIGEAKKVLVDEMTSTIYTVAKDTKFQVEFNPALVSEYRLLGYENRALADEDFKDDTKDGGELGAGHQVTVIYEIKLEGKGKTSGDLKYQDNVLSDKAAAKDEWCTLSIAYKDPDKDESKYLEYPIGVDNYVKNPSDDFIFATSVAEFSMALNDSEYLVDMTREEALKQAIKNVKKTDPDDDYRQEFLQLMQTVSRDDISIDIERPWYE